MKNIVSTLLLAGGLLAGGSSFVSAEENTQQREEVRMRSMLYAADYQSMLALVQKKQFAEAFPEILRYARYGDKYAQYLAGLLMVSGEDVPVNVEEGLVWMRLSLEQDTTDWKITIVADQVILHVLDNLRESMAQDHISPQYPTN